MLFHADRNIKENLFQMYKKDAEEHLYKKNELKIKKLNEEKEFLDNFNKRQQLEEEKKKFEKYKKVTETMNEYKDFMNNKDYTRLGKGKRNDVNFNTYSVRTYRPDMQPNLNYQQNYPNFSNQNEIHNNNQNINQNTYPVQNNYPKIEDDKFFNSDHRNLGNLNNDSDRVHKQEQQKYYKEYLDSQVRLNDYFI
jgi:hypothetical protein